MHLNRIFVVGASAGGVDALRVLAAGLPRDFPAPVLVVLHIGRHQSILPEILERSGPLGASRARHGQPLEQGHIHIAPPDRHMTVEDGRICLVHGPKEHHARPAIDPLFRSAALEYGPRAVGVILSGWGEDGTPGLQAIKHGGGCAVVQDPGTAQTSGMPFTALKYTPVDHCVRLEEMAPLLARLAADPVIGGHSLAHVAGMQHEHDLFLGRGDAVLHLEAIARPSPYACPDCGGGLWDLGQAQPPRFRCHAGHAYTLRSLQYAQSQRADRSLAAAISGLQEQSMLLRALAGQCLTDGDTAESARLQLLAGSVTRQADHLRRMVELEPEEQAGEAEPLSSSRLGAG
jgi:two-component system chemotaxis response regulator CheB